MLKDFFEIFRNRVNFFYAHYKGSIWNVFHDYGTELIFIECYDTNNNQIIPQGIEKVNNTKAVVMFPVPVEGSCLVFKLDSLLAPRVIQVNNVSDVWVYGLKDYSNVLIQFWKNGVSLEYPAEISLVNKKIYVRFSEPVTGTLIMCDAFPTEFLELDRINRILRFKYKFFKTYVFLQCFEQQNNQYSLILPETLKKDSNSIEIKGDFDLEKMRLNAILHGYRT